jgi:hypothetical protein
MPKIISAEIWCNSVSIKYGTFLLLMILVLQSWPLAAQDSAQVQDPAKEEKAQRLNRYAADESRRSQLPLFFEKEAAVGSPYFSESWMRGAAELSTHQVIPRQGESLYFNYDKLRIRLVVSDAYGNIRYYAPDSVVTFILVDSSNRYYTFEKISGISNSFFLETISKSEKGYSLYKRLLTRVSAADYQNAGYYSTGKKHDTYTDTYEYYLLFPDQKTFKKFFLDKKGVHKAFRQQALQMDSLYRIYDNRFNEQALVEMTTLLNKPFP